MTGAKQEKKKKNHTDDEKRKINRPGRRRGAANFCLPRGEREREVKLTSGYEMSSKILPNVSASFSCPSFLSGFFSLSIFGTSDMLLKGRTGSHCRTPDGKSG